MSADKKLLRNATKFVAPYRVTEGKGFRLRDFDPEDTGGIQSEAKPEAKEMLARGIQYLAEYQDKLYALGGPAGIPGDGCSG